MLGIAGKDGGSIEDAKDVGAKYLQSIMTGNFGDNVNVDAQSDAEMIQEGIDHHARKGK
ncbi:MAG: hypothetical protein K0R05_2888 [Anaerocolumna sp.]|jgi:hypothetical protein|nr:hypothetical protein [Anaerocolumna sp.]